MKTLIFCIATVAFTLSSHEIYADDLTSMVQNEIQVSQNEVNILVARATERLEKLRLLKLKAIAESKKKGESELNGKKLMDKYAALLFAKYHNKKDEFEKGMIISQKDQDNIGRLFIGYLYAQPLKEQTSVGEAKRILEIGAKTLDEMAKVHLNPTEKNNSQLEILEYQVQNADSILKKAKNLAVALGINVKSDKTTTVDRKTASKK